MSEMPMMKCGHVAQAIESTTGKPACITCFGLTPNAEIVADKGEFDLAGRMARCDYYGVQFKPSGYYANECPDCSRRYKETGVAICKCERPSSPKLAFFYARPDKEFDQFYCGCHSWE